MVALVGQIEALVTARGLCPGDRLPAERALAAELGVSRSRLREAMRELISRGIVTARQGGGTYLSEPGAAFALERALQPLGGLVRLESGFWRDVMEMRKSLDTDAAFYAAQRATEADKVRLVAALEAASNDDRTDPGVQAGADAALHMAIAEASHNAVLRQVMAGLFELMRISIAESLKQLFRLPQTSERLDQQHRAIVAAILAGEAHKARAAAAEHLAFVEDGLRQIEDEMARSRRASLAHDTLLLKEAKP